MCVQVWYVFQFVGKKANRFSIAMWSAPKLRAFEGIWLNKEELKNWFFKHSHFSLYSLGENMYREHEHRTKSSKNKKSVIQCEANSFKLSGGKKCSHEWNSCIFFRSYRLPFWMCKIQYWQSIIYRVTERKLFSAHSPICVDFCRFFGILNDRWLRFSLKSRNDCVASLVPVQRHDTSARQNEMNFSVNFIYVFGLRTLTLAAGHTLNALAIHFMGNILKKRIWPGFLWPHKEDAWLFEL